MLPEILIVKKPGVVIRSITLELGYTTFGRDAKSGICLEDPSVSRDHGTFYLRSGVLSVEDHRSMNGIFVNGLRIKRTVLYDSDHIQIGSFALYVKHGTDRPVSGAGI